MKPYLLLAVVLSSALLPSAQGAQKKMNVLLIAVDDMNNDLGCYGNPQVQSPNIDRLAKDGLRFNRAYCQFPLCSPSRTSVLTGRRPDTTRAFDLKYHFRQGLPDTVTLPQLFLKNGYYTARVGKLYHYGNPGQIGTSGLDDPASWQEFYNPAGRDKTTIEKDVIQYSGKPGQLGKSMAYLDDQSGTDLEHTDGKVATQAIELLEKHRDQPFFLAVGFYRPHCPYITPKGYFQKYSLNEITLPEIPDGEQSRVPAAALQSTGKWPYDGVTAEQARECKRAYYAAISFVDAQIGRVLDSLDRLGLKENTAIVFWSDHGYHLGEHGLWYKQSCYEESTRVPFIISVPGQKTRGADTQRTVELLDIYPTLADYAGLPAPGYVEGASLRPLLESASAAWERPAYSQVERNGFPGHSVRTERWRYTEWGYGEKGAELYDHSNDPGEHRNLFQSPEHAAVLAEMKALLKKAHPAKVEGGKSDPAFLNSLGLRSE